MVTLNKYIFSKINLEYFYIILYFYIKLFLYYFYINILMNYLRYFTLRNVKYQFNTRYSNNIIIILIQHNNIINVISEC